MPLGKIESAQSLPPIQHKGMTAKSPSPTGGKLGPIAVENVHLPELVVPAKRAPLPPIGGVFHNFPVEPAPEVELTTRLEDIHIDEAQTFGERLYQHDPVRIVHVPKDFGYKLEYVDGKSWQPSSPMVLFNDHGLYETPEDARVRWALAFRKLDFANVIPGAPRINLNTELLDYIGRLVSGDILRTGHLNLMANKIFIAIQPKRGIAPNMAVRKAIINTLRAALMIRNNMYNTHQNVTVTDTENTFIRKSLQALMQFTEDCENPGPELKLEMNMNFAPKFFNETIDEARARCERSFKELTFPETTHYCVSKLQQDIACLIVGKPLGEGWKIADPVERDAYALKTICQDTIDYHTHPQGKHAKLFTDLPYAERKAYPKKMAVAMVNVLGNAHYRLGRLSDCKGLVVNYERAQAALDLMSTTIFAHYPQLKEQEIKILN